jgi:hypothetical protein
MIGYIVNYVDILNILMYQLLTFGIGRYLIDIGLKYGRRT